MGGRGSPNNPRFILLSIHTRIKIFTIAILDENSKKLRDLTIPCGGGWVQG